MIYRVYCPWCRKPVAANLGDTDKIVRGFAYEADILAKHRDGREGHLWVLPREEIKAVRKSLSLKF